MVKYCMAVIPSADLHKSLRFWTEGIGLTAINHMYDDDKLVGCMVTYQSLFFWLNQRAGEPIPDGFEGIRLYWTPDDIVTMRVHLADMGYAPSEIVTREYGQTEFFVTDDDGYLHCFGVELEEKSDQ